LYNAWCHGSQLCFHPWRVLLVIKLKSIFRILMLEIRIPCIRLLQSTIPPLWRIWKELTPKCFSWCYNWSKLSTQEVANVLL
jgi:hypothetical protein